MKTKDGKIHKMTPKQKRCAYNFCDKNNKETYGNKLKSYVQAGYKDSPAAKQAACTLFNSPYFLHYLNKFEPEQGEIVAKKREIQKDYALTTHQELYDRCFDDHDNTSCVALLRMYWQGAGLLSERLVIDVQDSRKFDADYTKEAKRIASIVLETQGLPDHAPDTIGHDQLNSGFDTVSDQFLEPPPAIETPQHIVLPDVVDETISGTDFLSDD